MPLPPDSPGQRLPSPVRPMSVEEALRRHEREMRRNQRPVRGAKQAAATAGSAVESHRFTHYGLVATDTDPSVPFEPAVDMLLVGARARLSVAGVSPTTIAVRINGTTIGEVAWSTGATLATPVFDDLLTADTSLLTIQCVEAGTGASGVVIRFDMVPAS